MKGIRHKLMRMKHPPDGKRRYMRWIRRTTPGWHYRYAPPTRLAILARRRRWPKVAGLILPPDPGEDRFPELREGLLAWEEAVRWIAQGWDCIEEYTNDVWARLNLEFAMKEHAGRHGPQPLAFLRRLASIDRLFRRVTHDSRLCCLQTGPLYAYCNGHMALRYKHYPKRKFWFFYRWQPDTDYPYRDHDTLSYQRVFYGMDFAAMNQAALEDRVREQVTSHLASGSPLSKP
jgi:hypothetical protein